MTRVASPSPSRLAAWMLQTLLARDRARALLGDIAEEYAGRVARGRAPRWPRLWCESRALLYLTAEARAALPPSARALAQTLRDSVRALRSAPATTAFILIILTLGISAATVTFSVVDAVVLRRLPFPRSENLVVLRQANGRGAIFSPQEFVAWHDAPGVFSGVAAYFAWTQDLPASAGGETVGMATTTSDLFSLLAVPPEAGRWLLPGDEAPGRHVAVISHRLAQRQFGGAAQALGRALPAPSSTVIVVGVMPAGFGYPIDLERPVDLWTPLDVTSARYSAGGDGFARYFRIVGRLAAGVGSEQARAGLDAASAALRQTFPRAAADWPPRVVGLYDSLVGGVRGWMLLVLAAVGLVMLVSCANVANLLLARSTDRARELSVRASIGASRRQLVAGLLVESLVLSLVAGTLGILVAGWGIGLAKAALPAGIPRAGAIALDLRVLGAAIAAAALTGLTFGAVPAWQASRVDLLAVLKDTGAATAGGRHRWRAAFVVLEVAFVGVLLVATTLVIASFVNVTRADLGFDRDRLIATDMVRVAGPLDKALEALARVPGVVSAAAMGGGSPPLLARGGYPGGSTGMALHRPDRAGSIGADSRRVSDSYFRTAGTPLLRGGGFESVAGPSVVLDERAAEALFPDRDPVGATVRLGYAGSKETTADDLTVAGVVSHVHTDGPEAAVGPQVYLPLVRRDGSRQPLPLLNGGSLLFLVRTGGPARSSVPAVVTTVAAIAPPPAGRPAPRAIVVEDAFRNITADRRFNAGLMGVFGGLALVIGVAGVYGVMSTVVAQRTREIGVRVALGATPARIRRDVVNQAARYLTVGAAAGLLPAWLVARSFGSLYFGVAPTTASIYVTVSGVLVATGVLAAWLPARRAARVDPIVTLKA